MTCATHLALERAQLKKLLFETCCTTRTHHLQQHLQKRAISPTGYLNTRHEQTHNLERSIIGLKDLRTQTAPGVSKQTTGDQILDRAHRR